MEGFVVADPLRRKVAVDFPVQSVVIEAVAARSARHADAVYEPLCRYQVAVIDW